MILRLKNILIVTILLGMSLFSSVYAQKRITTLSGQRIILMPDATWEHDIIMVKEDSLGMLYADLDPKKIPEKKKYHIQENQQKGLTLLRDSVLSREIRQVIILEGLKNRFAELTNNLTFAKKGKVKDQAKISSLESTRLDTKVGIEQTQMVYNQLFKQYNKIQSLFDANEESRNKDMKSLADDLGINIGAYLSAEGKREKSQTNLTLTKSEIDYKPIVVCKKDSTYSANIKTRAVATELRPWFDFTADRMKNLLKGKDLINTTCGITRHDGHNYLRVRIVVASKAAFKTYGTIPAGNFMKVTLVTGKSFNIINAYQCTGVLENYTGFVVYETEFLLRSDDASLLRKNPIDTVGIMWSSGFELYPIYEVDAVMNAFDCFDSF